MKAAIIAACLLLAGCASGPHAPIDEPDVFQPGVSVLATDDGVYITLATNR